MVHTLFVTAGRKHRAAVSLMLLICAVLCCRAVEVRRYNERDGLFGRQAYSICTDGSGYVWTFTGSGVSRFDGSEFRDYPLVHLDRSRPYALYLSKLRLMPDSSVAVSFSSGQVLRYDRMVDRFEPLFDLADHGVDTRLNNFVITPDTTAVCSTNDGVYIYKEGQLHRIALAGHTVNDVIELSDGAVLAATENGLFRLTERPGAAEWDAAEVPSTAGVPFTVMREVGDRIFIGTKSAGLMVSDNGGRSVSRPETGLPEMPVRAFAATEGGVMVALDGGGLYDLDARTLRERSHIGYSLRPPGLSANTVSDLWPDGSGGFWVATTSHGINHVDESRSVYRMISEDSPAALATGADCINAVYQDSDGDMWFGTDAGLSLRRRDGTWEHFLNRPRGVDTNFLTITEAPDGFIYAGGYGSGAWRIDKRQHTATRLPSRQGNRGIDTEYVFTIFCEGSNIWYGGIQGSISRHDTATDTWQYYPAECSGDFLTDGRGTVFFTGCGGFGTAAPGGELRWSHKIGALDINSTRDAVFDAGRRELWIATETQGLVRYSLATGKATFENDWMGPEPDDVYGLTLDRSGRVWFYTERDVFIINEARDSISRVTPLLDIEGLSLIPRAIITDRDGNIVIGSANGAVSIDPALGASQPTDVRLIISDISVNHKRLYPGDDTGIIDVAADNLDELRLDHDRNTFAVHFSALYFGNNRQIGYRWRLKGFDDDWQPADPQRIIICRNVPVGSYDLEIEAFNSVTGAPLDVRVLKVRILPPPWLSWWAVLIYVLLAAAAILVVTHGIRRRRHEERITDKIHSFLNVIQDLRTPVTLIKAPLGEIERHADLPEGIRRNASLAMKNVEKLLSIIGRLMDLRHESEHSDCLNLTETDIRDFLDTKVSEWRTAAISKGLTLDVNVPADMPPVMIDRNKMSHILDNLISNAIKYTFHGGVTISTRFDQKRWQLSVADTGVGIPRSGIQHLFRREYRSTSHDTVHELGSGMGVLIVSRLCRLHHGRIKVMSLEGDGTEFELTFPRTIKSRHRVLPPPDADESKAAPEPQPAPEEAPEKETIVLIDGERAILDYLSQNLSDTYRVETFEDAASALEQIENINPGIVISETRLRGMSGFELCQKLKTSVETSHIPVVFLSGMSERQNIIFGLESGASDYIVKPFDISVLRLRLQNLLKIRHHLQSRVRKEEEQSTAGRDETISDLDREFIERVRETIDSNITEPEFNTQTLCEAVGMSRTTMFNKIKALTGESISEFIRTHRLNKAQELLLTRRYNISEVAYMVGFADPKYFSTCFKKQFGVSPSKI